MSTTLKYFNLNNQYMQNEYKKVIKFLNDPEKTDKIKKSEKFKLTDRVSL
jgi:hypothetical protein